jgi:hypothetical protein
MDVRPVPPWKMAPPISASPSRKVELSIDEVAVEHVDVAAVAVRHLLEEVGLGAVVGEDGVADAQRRAEVDGDRGAVVRLVVRGVAGDLGVVEAHHRVLDAQGAPAARAEGDAEDGHLGVFDAQQRLLGAGPLHEAQRGQGEVLVIDLHVLFVRARLDREDVAIAGVIDRLFDRAVGLTRPDVERGGERGVGQQQEERGAHVGPPRMAPQYPVSSPGGGEQRVDALPGGRWTG